MLLGCDGAAQWVWEPATGTYWLVTFELYHVNLGTYPHEMETGKLPVECQLFRDVNIFVLPCIT